jgi:hypothetical protein
VAGSRSAFFSSRSRWLLKHVVLVVLVVLGKWCVRNDRRVKETQNALTIAGQGCSAFLSHHARRRVHKKRLDHILFRLLPKVLRIVHGEKVVPVGKPG